MCPEPRSLPPLSYLSCPQTMTTTTVTVGGAWCDAYGSPAAKSGQLNEKKAASTNLIAGIIDLIVPNEWRIKQFTVSSLLKYFGFNHEEASTGSRNCEFTTHV